MTEEHGAYRTRHNRRSIPRRADNLSEEIYVLQDLNTLISSTSGWVLNSATGINIWGQIVGSGTLNGQSHGFLLTPRKL